MIKLWFPKTMEECNQQSVPQYISYCNLAMYTLRNKLRTNINSARWGILTPKLTQSTLIEITNPMKFNARQIPDQYISKLVCGYDENRARCYYYVPDNVKCLYTSNSLNQIVELIEYGNDLIPPMNWLRYSYQKFIDALVEIVK